jgi:dolichol-phosphate mannosyltransferase
MLSIVIPVLNEGESLPTLYTELCEVAQAHAYDLDVILIDDGSTDASWSIIDEICQRDSRFRGIRFRRNFGKAAALSAGFAAARGQWVMTLDADLQDDPREIPKFLAVAERDVDVISGWKKKRYDPWHKVLPSRAFNWLVSRMTGVVLHDHNCGFKCYRREVFDRMRLYGELHRFVPVLAAARGWRVGEVVVNHRPRVHGRSKYGLLRIPKGFLDLLTVKFLTGYGQRPQHVLGTLGLACFAFGSLGIATLTIWWILSRVLPGWEDVHLTQRAIFFYCLAATLLGGQFMSIGFLAELMTALHGREADTYSVAERVGGDAGWRMTDDRAGARAASSASAVPAAPAVPRKEPVVAAPHIKPALPSEATREML